jgi:hypothetical protein
MNVTKISVGAQHNSLWRLAEVIFQDRKIAGDASRRRGPPEGKSHKKLWESPGNS